MSHSRLFSARLAAIFLLLSLAISVRAQQVVYDNALENGWQNLSWASVNFANTSPVHNGRRSISVTSTGAWQALALGHSPFDTTPYGALTFWVNGGPSGGQKLQVTATVNGMGQAYSIGTLAANTWQQVSIPLTTLGVDQKPNVDSIQIAEVSGTTPPVYYVADMSLTAASQPGTVHLSVNAASHIRTLDTRLLGTNITFAESDVNSTATQSLFTAAGFKILRWPGGSGSDMFNWATNKSDGYTFMWGASTGTFVNLALACGATGMITTNYGSGTPQMAAAWVAYFNGSSSSTQSIGVDSKGTNWQTVGYWASLRAAAPLATDDGYNFLRINHPASLHFQQYEIGNECYGSWENDTHGQAGSGLTGTPHDPYTYAQYAAQFIAAMRAVDSTIKIGCVAVPGEDNYNGGSHSVANPNESNTLHSGWTPVVLSTLHSLGYVPDFLVHHRYPEQPGLESDGGLLSDVLGWKSEATDLRKQITDYVGAAGSAMELDATEANNTSFSPGKQSISLVNALYMADSIGIMGQTEFNTLNWWETRSGPNTGNNNSALLYGWRNYGDYGLISSPNSPDAANTGYPLYYSFKLASHWVTSGAISVASTSDYSLLTAYGALQSDGSLALLVINKSPNYNLSGSITLTGFTPGTTATTYSYGKSNDLANSDLTTSSLTGLTFPYTTTFPSYSMTVIKFVPSVNVPAAPSSIVTQGYFSQAILWWSASTGATSYNVRRSTTSGGPYVTIGTTTGTSYVDSGLNNGTTYYYVITATNAGGTSGNSPQGVVTPAAPISINCGGSATGRFSADSGFSGGTAATPWSGSVDTSAVSQSAPLAVYRSERNGNFTYTISGLAAGSGNTVRLHFTEDTYTASGQRKFNVAINSTSVLTNFDIFASSGAQHKANIQAFNTLANSSGQIVIAFTGVIQTAKIDGIEMY